ncbi:MAG: hypothetical protein M3N49_10095 [Candidatus Eremiobacteraeota bacterium]|nr:hypothetical protein [Candidatus Eremiobacteraeota bacterium]
MRTDDRFSLDFSRLRAVVIEEFARRTHHQRWPPVFTMPDAWRDELERDAKLIEFATFDPDELGRQFRAFIAEIEGIVVKQTHDYKFLSLQMNLSGSEPVEAQAERQLQALVTDGWRIVFAGPRPGYVDQFLAILERALKEEAIER